MITAPWWAYFVAALIALVGLLGSLKALLPGGALWDQPSFSRRALGWLALAGLANGVAFVRWAVATGAPYGRLLFPTIGAVGVFIAWGWAQWRGSVQRLALILASGLALLFSALAPWLLVRPAFRTPYLESGLPSSAELVSATRAGPVSFLGYEFDEGDLAPGDSLDVILYWRAEAPIDAQLSVWLQLGSADPTQRVAGDTRWLGGTLYPTPQWRVGDTIAHQVTLRVPDWAEAPALYWLRFGLLDGQDRRVPFGAVTSDHLALGPLRVRHAVDVPGDALHVGARLGTDIELAAYQVVLHDLRMDLTLHWEATGDQDADYTVFVHLIDQQAELLAQDDRQPADGAYPTSWWRVGDRVTSNHALPLAQPWIGEALSLLVGLYHPATGERLVAYTATGKPLCDAAIPLEIPWR